MNRFIDLVEKGDSYCYNTITAIDLNIPGMENAFVVGDAFM
jgi:hypothetical protein